MGIPASNSSQEKSSTDIPESSGEDPFTTIRLHKSQVDNLNSLKRGKMTHDDVVAYLIGYYTQHSGNDVIRMEP